MVMSVNITAQTLLFLRSMLLGACLMLLYDALRILRLACSTPAWLVFLEDIAYCAVCAAATFAFLVSASYGEIRLFTLLGEALGAVLCALTLSRVLMACSRTIIGIIRRILRLLWCIVRKIFLRPVIAVCRWIADGIVNSLYFCSVSAKKTLKRANFGLKRKRFLLYNLMVKHRRNPPADASPAGENASGGRSASERG